MIRRLHEKVNRGKIKNLDRTILMYAKRFYDDYKAMSGDDELYDYLEENADSCQKLADALKLLQKAWNTIHDVTDDAANSVEG